MRRRAVIKGAASGLAALAAPRIARGQSGRILKFIPQADLALVDPVQSTAIVTRNHGVMVFDTLYGLDESFNPQPQMAEGHVVEDDGRTWRIALRPGLKWHDGTPVLARDAVASTQRWWQIDAFGQSLRAVTDELTAPSDTEVRFRLKKPFPLHQRPGIGGRRQRAVPFPGRRAHRRVACRLRPLRRLRAPAGRDAELHGGP